MIKKISELSGWIGMILIHSATLPVTLGIILGYTDTLPPASMILLVWSGLFLFLIRAIAQNDKLYIISNSIGFFFNSILLILIVFWLLYFGTMVDNSGNVKYTGSIVRDKER